MAAFAAKRAPAWPRPRRSLSDATLGRRAADARRPCHRPAHRNRLRRPCRPIQTARWLRSSSRSTRCRPRLSRPRCDDGVRRHGPRAWGRAGIGTDPDERLDEVSALIGLPMWTQTPRLFGPYAAQVDEARSEVGFDVPDRARDRRARSRRATSRSPRRRHGRRRHRRRPESDPLWSADLTTIESAGGPYFTWGDDPLAPRRPHLADAAARPGRAARRHRRRRRRHGRAHLDPADMETVLTTAAGRPARCSTPTSSAPRSLHSARAPCSRRSACPGRSCSIRRSSCSAPRRSRSCSRTWSSYRRTTVSSSPSCTTAACRRPSCCSCMAARRAPRERSGVRAGARRASTRRRWSRFPTSSPVRRSPPTGRSSS